MEWLSRYRAHNDKLAMRLQMNKISERCPHCGAPAGKTCAEWNSGLELKNGCPPREGAGAYVPAQLRQFVRRGADAQRAVDEIVKGAPPPMTAIGQELDHDLSELERRQGAKLLVSRIHRVAAQITAGPDSGEKVIAFANLRLELYELADEIEELLTK